MNSTIENKYFKLEVSSLGAEIQHFEKKDDGTQLIWNGDKDVWKNHAPVLFPFIGRCLGGYFMIEGKKCEFSKNHGFARDMEAKLLKSEKDKLVYELTENEESLKVFPYRFSLFTEYQLTDKGLNWKLTVENKDTKSFRFGLGTHAAFACPRNTDEGNTKISDYQIEFDKKVELECLSTTADGFIDISQKNGEPYTKKFGEKEKGIIPLTEEGFGNGILILNSNFEWVGIRNKINNSLVSISTKGFPYCMLWQNVKGKAQFVCLEPWHGLPDAINTNHEWKDKIGMNQLEPGKTFTCSQNIRVEF